MAGMPSSILLGACGYFDKYRPRGKAYINLHTKSREAACVGVEQQWEARKLGKGLKERKGKGNLAPSYVEGGVEASHTPWPSNLIMLFWEVRGLRSMGWATMSSVAIPENRITILRLDCFHGILSPSSTWWIHIRGNLTSVVV